MSVPARGQVYWADLGAGPKPWLVVSENRRNRNLPSFVAVRITTTARHSGVPTVVPLGSADPLVGFVVCDDINQFYRDEVGQLAGALSPGTMRVVDDGLRLALSL